jgi:glycosyltransferase involved in cell wall biosynthesis
VPVVASRVGGIPEVVDEGVTGYLHDGDDLDGMAGSVSALLSDRALWQRMSNAAGEAAHARYCDHSIVPLYEAYYEFLLKSPKRPAL